MDESTNRGLSPLSGDLASFNMYFLASAAVLGSYFAVRETLFGDPSGFSVLLEWLSLALITVLLGKRRLSGPKWLRAVVAFLAAVVVLRSVSNLQSDVRWPEYWWGFGLRVLLVLVPVAVLCLAVLLILVRIVSCSRRQLNQGATWIFGFLGWVIIAWTIPSLLQPMDAWLNVGDSTEKVLDEVAGWTVWNVPGVHTGWGHNSLLGAPLAPLSLISGLGEAKIILVVLYVNLLILLIPLCMGWIIRQLVPELRGPASFAIAVVSVTISGTPFNTSLFQELSFLARGLLPVVMGAFTVHSFGKKLHPNRVQNFVLIVGCTLTFWNNLEYGFGACVAVGVVAIARANDAAEALRQFRGLILGFVLTSLVVLAPGILIGGNWLNRRLGAIGILLEGGAQVQSFNNTGPIPPFGLPTLCLALGTAAVVMGLNDLRDANESRNSAVGAISALYFGVWTVVAAPYFLNGGGSGAFRTQFLNIQTVMLVFSILGILGPKIPPMLSSSLTRRRSVLGLGTVTFAALPIILLGSLTVSSVVQVPNGVKEWRRVQTPTSISRHVDEWSPYRLDWIRPSLIPELVEGFGGERNVGWWFSYGNAIEALTGVENLLGTTAYESTRTSTQLSLACEPLIRSHKRYVISINSGESLMSKCAGIKATARTGPNDDGLVVFEIARAAKSPTN